MLASCTTPTGFVANASDCDDTDPFIHPGALEICNQVDDDCDGELNEGLIWGYHDKDQDGYGDPGDIGCTLFPPWYISNGQDCNDTDAFVHPGGLEICNQMDDDCDGEVDDGLIWGYHDKDQDGYGDPGDIGCILFPPWYITRGGDCNDYAAAVNPAAPDDTCDGFDQDCSGAPDDGYAPQPTEEVCGTGACAVAGWTYCESATIQEMCWAASPIATTDSTCDGVDDNCDASTDEEAAGSCLCAERGRGLVGWWPGDGDAYDATGHFAGTLGGAAGYAPGRVGQGFALDGTGWVELADTPLYGFTTGMTLEAWIRPDDVGADRQIFSKFGTVGSWAYQVGIEPVGRLRVQFSGTGTSWEQEVSLAGVLSPGVWSHIAVTFDAGVVRLYVDGEQVASRRSVAGITSLFAGGTTRLNIGRDPAGTDYFVGLIDEPAVYARALSLAEVRAIYASGTAGMCRCWDMDGDGYGAGGGVSCGLGLARDCNDADSTAYPGPGGCPGCPAEDTTCDGIDDDCDAGIDEDFVGGCQCAQRGTEMAGLFRAEGTAGLGTLMGTAGFATGRVGQAFSLDGDGWVRVLDSTAPEFTSQFTLETWIRPDDVSGNRQIVSKFGTTGNYSYEMSVAPGGVLRADVSGDGTTYFALLSPPAVLVAGRWTHVSATFGTGDLRLYADGILVAAEQVPVTAVFAAGTSDLNIGRDPVGSQYFIGLIDEVGLYSRRLGPAEVRAIYEAGGAGMCPCNDLDRDGYGAPGSGLCYTGTQPDCNISDPLIHPGAAEQCNGVDDDCDGALDDGLPQSTFFRDLDNDGFGNAAVSQQACAAPVGYIAAASDCDDAKSWVHPGAPDANCDGIDEDCSGAPDQDYASPPDGWIATPAFGYPVNPLARRDLTMVSTGDRVIVWGGFTSLAAPTNTGAVYRPVDGAGDMWTATSTGANVPPARQDHTAAWTGTEMIVWGGVNGGTYLSTGSRYDPTSDTWTAMTATGVPTGRAFHSAVWTGSKLIIWGGFTGSAHTNTGAIYDPLTNTWSAMTLTGAPAARSRHAAVWTGTEMIVWGGGGSGGYLNSGGRYNPATNTWAAMASGPLAGREGHGAVWTGAQMLVWGGQTTSTWFGDGAAFDPATGFWTALPAAALSARSYAAVVWDPVDARMIVWGGANASTYMGDGKTYDPATLLWTALPASGAPVARTESGAAWLNTTREFVVWGGAGGAGVLGSGGRTVVAPYTCGLDACEQPSRYVCVAGTITYGCALTGASPPPAGVPVLSLTQSAGTTSLSWSPDPDATHYDVVRGSLSTLRGSGGDFTQSTAACMVNDATGSSALDSSGSPPPGAAIWYLLRPLHGCNGNGTYNDGSPSQQANRDSEIATAPGRCPW